MEAVEAVGAESGTTSPPAPTASLPPAGRPARRPSARRVAAAAVLATLGSLVAVLAVLRLAPPGPAAAALPAGALPPEVAAGPCDRLAGALPDVLGGLDRRATSPDDPRLTAWGRPAAVLACGVRVPGSARFRPAVTVDGVSWDYRDAGDVVEWTTVDRRDVQVQLRVPTTYDAQELLLADLVAPLQGSIEQVPLEVNLPVDPSLAPPG